MTDNAISTKRSGAVLIMSILQRLVQSNVNHIKVQETIIIQKHEKNTSLMKCLAKSMSIIQTLKTYCDSHTRINPFLNEYSKICVKRPLKNRQNKDLNEKW